MATEAIIDLDAVLMGWATVRLGADHIVEKVDTSKLDVTQRSLSYHSSQDWWSNATVHEEFFDNDESHPASWQYTHKVGYQSHASWSLSRAFKSTRFVPIQIAIQYPVGIQGTQPLEVIFDTTNLNTKQSTKNSSEWTVSSPVEVEPYSSTHVSAKVRSCSLQNVVFTKDIVLSGSIKVVGHKKNRKWNKNEMTVGIADALSGKESLGFMVYDNTSDPNGPARTVTFKVEGLCTGEVGVEPVVKLEHISSLV